MAAADSKPAPRILGLTGPIGCGKTTVGNLLLELGAVERIDADQVVHELMTEGSPTTAAIAATFGEDVLGTDGRVDRARLGRVVFRDPDALRRLEAITHPAVRTSIRERLAAHGDDGVVVIDAVKLLQSELLPLVEAVWVVSCSPQAQLRRLTEARGMSEEEARARIAAMPSFASDRVTELIENSGSIEQLRHRVGVAWGSYLSEPRRS